jgi:DNA topoisomerase-1
MVVKTGRFGRFLACSRYPECKTTKPFSVGVVCPEPGCGGQVVEKKSRKGKMFYGCSNYPKCTFATWNKPVATPCPSCGNPYLEEKFTKTSGATLVCPKCKHTISKEPPAEAA